jgi:ribulose-bisphosphate carboxylase large chain
MTAERVEASYLIETGVDVDRAVETMAGEQSSGTFVPVPGETPELKARSGARVEALELIGEVAAPSLPGARRDAGLPIRQAKVRLSWPVENFGASLPNLFTTVAGNLFELQQFSGLRVLDVRFSPAFFARYPGPAFGIGGTRALAGVEGRPIIGTIVKPSVGFSARQVADLVTLLGEAGIDFVKDDELQADGPVCPFDDRVSLVTEAIDRLAQKTGNKLMYAFNLTGEVDEMLRRHDLVARAGGTCVMVVLNSAGLAGLTALRRHASLPIHGHRAGWGSLSRHPLLGWSYVAWSKFWRLAGADHLHVNGLRNKFCETDESVIEAARSLITPLDPACPAVAMPVFSSGQTVGQVADTHAALGTTDLMYLTGGGIMGHPDGPAAGVAAMRQAWEAAMQGIALARHAQTHPALARAIGALNR